MDNHTTTDNTSFINITMSTINTASSTIIIPSVKVDETIGDIVTTVPNDTTNETLAYIPMATRPEQYLVPIVFALIFVIGVIGNSSLVYFFIKYPQMRSVPNTYILSLAIGDLLVLVFTMPFASVVFTMEDFPFGEVVCKLQEVMRDVSIGVTVLTLTVLSVNRYFAIVKPWKKQAVGSANTKLITLFIWILSFVLAIPAGTFTHIHHFPKSNSETFASCYPFPEYLGPYYPRINVLVKFLVYYSIPLFIIANCYIMMAIHLLRQDIPGECLSQQRNHLKHTASRRKVAKMVLAFVFIFAICFFPNNLFMMWFYFHPTSHDDFNHFWNTLRIVGFCLTFINSCINPIALYWISGTFRKYYNRHLFCIKTADVGGASISHYHFHSSVRTFPTTITRTDQFEMSSANGPDRVNV